MYPATGAQVTTIDIGRLQDKDADEAAKLLKAAKEDGVFYLSLQDKRCGDIESIVDEIFNLSKQLFNLSRSEKLHCDVDKLSECKLNGYFKLV